MHCAKMLLLHIQLTCFAYIVNFINTQKYENHVLFCGDNQGDNQNP